ncbi:hypothetical protein BST61_g7353 [Cercospora zeina]
MVSRWQPETDARAQRAMSEVVTPPTRGTPVSHSGALHEPLASAVRTRAHCAPADDNATMNSHDPNDPREAASMIQQRAYITDGLQYGASHRLVAGMQIPRKSMGRTLLGCTIV